MFIREPSNWLAAVAVTAFFGFCAVVFAFMLLTRRQQAA
jgi:hypothetical protein